MGRFSKKKYLLSGIIFFGIVSLCLASSAYAVPIVISNDNHLDPIFTKTPNRINVSVTDDTSTITTVLLSITSPEVNNHNMQQIAPGIYEYNFTPSLTGVYSYYIWAMNSDGASNSSTTHTFTSLDDKPVVDQVTDSPDPVVVAQQSIGISANVTDPDGNLDKVWLEIRYPQNQTQNITMANVSGTYFASYTPAYVLTYKYTIWANDTKGNLASAKSCTITTCYIKEYDFVSQSPVPLITDVMGDRDNIYIRVPLTEPTPNITLSANVTDVFGTLDKVWIKIYYPNGTKSSEQQLSSATDIYTYTYYPDYAGTYVYTFNATDISGTSSTVNSTFNTVLSSPEFYAININPIHTAIPIGDKVTVNVDVTDPHNDLDKVWIEIVSPITGKYFMTNTGGNRYEINYTVQNDGAHLFYIRANDSRNNIAGTSRQTFSDKRVTAELNVSVVTKPYCCSKYDYFALDLASNYTQFKTFNPFINYGALKLIKADSLLSNCGNLDVNVTNNCITLRKEVLEPGEENITITGDTSTHVVAYCCWNENHLSSRHGIPSGYGTYLPTYGAFGGTTWFCEWDKSLVPMPPFMINNFEEFFMHYSYEVLYDGWYNLTASADYERYNQSDCDTYGYNTDRCSCSKNTNMTIRFLKREEKGTYPNPIPFPIPTPISGEFISEPDIVIIREMPEYIYQKNETCNPTDPWNTCTYTKIKLILFNRGSKPAYDVILNDTSIVSDEDYINYCSAGGNACNPVAYQCINHSYYTCTEGNKSGYLSFSSFEFPDPIEPRNYALVEYRFIPAVDYRPYVTNPVSYYDFDASSTYVHRTISGGFNINITKNVTEDDATYNPDYSDRLYLTENAAFSYELDSSNSEAGENRNFPVNTYTVFDVNLITLLGKQTISPPWESKISLPDSWTVSGCSRSIEADCDCSYSNIGHWVKCERTSGSLSDLQSLNFQFTAKTTEISNFLLPVNSFDRNSMAQTYSPGIFAISNPIERVTQINPDLVIIREMPQHMIQKNNCNANDAWNNCTYTGIKLVIYNRGAGIANNVTVKDSFELGACSLNNTQACDPLAYRCLPGTEHIVSSNATNSTNSSSGAVAWPYTCAKTNETASLKEIEFNVTEPIYPFDYRVIEYEFAPANNLSAYADNNYYKFNAEADYKNTDNEIMTTSRETDATYNPFGSNFMLLSNSTAFDYDIEIEKEFENDTFDRDFAYGINTTFSLNIKAHTGDLKVTAPWHADISLPYSWIIESCSSNDGNCDFNSTQHWLRINSTQNLTDGQTISFRFNGNARERKDFLLPIYSNDTSDSNSMNENYIPGLWTISRLTHLVNVTIYEPYPQPVPEPEPVPTPVPVPVPVPEPVPLNVPYQEMVLSIKPLNWTLQTYPGEGLTVKFELENVGNSTINNLVLDALHFSDWEYGTADVESLAPGEIVNRTIFVKPSLTAKKGFYVIPVRGIINGTKILDTAFFQMEVLEGISKVNLKIIEFSNILDLEEEADTFVPVLLKNTGTIDLHNISIDLENMDECITQKEFFQYELKVNETGVAYFKIRTGKDPKTCKGSMIISSKEGAFAFSQFRLTVKPPAPMIPKDYTTLIIIVLYALIITIYAIYRRRQAKKEKEEQPVEGTEASMRKEASESRKDKIMKYLLIIAGIALTLIAAYWIITKI